jgi:hypothetical protein
MSTKYIFSFLYFSFLLLKKSSRKKMKKTIEENVAETILQQSKKIKIGDNTFNVAPTTTATLIEVSNLISKLPAISLNQENIVLESLMIAKNCEIIGTIAATLILGVPRHTNTPSSKNNVLKRLILRKSVCNENIYDELGKEILSTLSPHELEKLIVELLENMELSHFFAITTSLLEVNLLRASKEVV